jgi:hypothetical protein
VDLFKWVDIYTVLVFGPIVAAIIAVPFLSAYNKRERLRQHERWEAFKNGRLQIAHPAPPARLKFLSRLRRVFRKPKMLPVSRGVSMGVYFLPSKATETEGGPMPTLPVAASKSPNPVPPKPEPSRSRSPHQYPWVG